MNPENNLDNYIEQNTYLSEKKDLKVNTQANIGKLTEILSKNSDTCDIIYEKCADLLQKDFENNKENEVVLINILDKYLQANTQVS